MNFKGHHDLEIFINCVIQLILLWKILSAMVLLNEILGKYFFSKYFSLYVSLLTHLFIFNLDGPRKDNPGNRHCLLL